MKQLLFCAITVASLIFIFSCSKINDRPPTPQQVDSVKIFGVDSSQLVKSLTTVWTDSMGNFQDSSSVYFYYDTVNRKIYTAPMQISGPNPANYAYIFSYNTSYQLSNLKINPAGLDTGDAVLIDFMYDNQQVISSENATHVDGIMEAKNFLKTSLPSGYSLSSKDAFIPGDTSLTSFNFDAGGRLVSWSVTNLPAVNSWFSDSLVYDASGNINVVIENDSFFVSPLNAFEMSSRAAKGNELSILNKVLFNGVSQLPDAASGNFESGSVLNGYNNNIYYQFTDYPASSTTVYQQYSNSYVTFSPDAQYDSKNRLTSLKNYNGDGSFYYETEKLTYYK
jgi:hypothetical protein